MFSPPVRAAKRRDVSPSCLEGGSCYFSSVYISSYLSAPRIIRELTASTSGPSIMGPSENHLSGHSPSRIQPRIDPLGAKMYDVLSVCVGVMHRIKKAGLRSKKYASVIVTGTSRRRKLQSPAPGRLRRNARFRAVTRCSPALPQSTAKSRATSEGRESASCRSRTRQPSVL